MKLLTADIIKKLPKFGAMEKKKPEETPIIVKFFATFSNWTWYVTEGEKQEDGSWLFFGWVHGDFPELGYFGLAELEEIKGPFGLGIERDMHFGDHTLAECMKERI